VQILADENVPEAYVSALRGDGHEVTYSRNVDALGRAASDDAVLAHAESKGLAVLSTDVKDFANRDVAVPVFVAPQNMTGGEVRAAISRIELLAFDPAEADPIWLSGL
jgi:predicted nuclease of predicted toxin-antitoxin system